MSELAVRAPVARGSGSGGARGYALPLSALVVTWIYFVATTADFRGEASIYPVLQGFALLGIVALGVGITMIAGELDMSVASMAAAGGVIAVRTADVGLVPCLIIAVVAGGLFGAAQGYAIARLNINSLVFTIGTLILLRGLTYLLADNKPVLLDDLSVADPLLQRWGVLAPDILVAAALFGALGVFLAWTRAGRELYATGGGRPEASAAGISVRRSIVAAFTCSAALAALAGGIAALKGGSAAPGNYQEVLLTGVAAALIGGISLYGGRGTVLNVVLGVAVISTITAGLAAKGSQGYVAKLATGALLVAVITVEYLGARVAAARARDRRSPPRVLRS